MAQKVFDILPPKKRKKIIIKSERKFPKSFFFWIFLFFVCLISSFFFASFYFSKAEIEIYPQINELTFETKIENLKGQIIEETKEKLLPFSASGEKVKKEYARGKIRVYNKSSESITLIKRTRFLSAEGKQFRILKQITIPPKSYLDGVEVKAEEPGEEYNIPPTTFSVPGLVGTNLYSLVYGESFTKMEGGFTGKVKYVTKEDLEKAKKAILERAFEYGKKSLKEKYSKDYVLLEDLLYQQIIDKYPVGLTGPGAELSIFYFKAKVKSRALAFEKKKINEFLEKFLSEKIPPSQKLIKNSVKVNFSVLEKDLKEKTATLSLNIFAKAYFLPDFSDLKEKIRGKNLSQAKIFLESQYNILKAEIKISPFWVKSLPIKKEKIKFKLKI